MLTLHRHLAERDLYYRIIIKIQANLNLKKKEMQLTQLLGGLRLPSEVTFGSAQT